MSVWNNLKFNAMPAVISTVSSFHQSNTFFNLPDLKYRNNRSVSIFVHMAKRFAMQALEQEVHKLANKWLDNWSGNGKRKLEAAKRVDENVKRQKANFAKLIENQQVLEKEERAGKLKLKDVNYQVLAMDKYGNKVPEAMILYYDNEKEPLTFTGFVQNGEDIDFQKTQSYTTKTWFHIDLTPDIQMNSSKNIVMTQVTGRDCTRKELVSGGDLQFSVSGTINSNEPGVYPSEAVKKFVKMMQYNGVINVNSFQFNQLNVDRIVIRDFSLSTPSYKNIQPYSFNCVAIEPDEDIAVVNDTIAQVNDAIQERVYTQSVDLVAILKQKTLELASDMAIQSVGMGLDALTKNI